LQKIIKNIINNMKKLIIFGFTALAFTNTNAQNKPIAKVSSAALPNKTGATKVIKVGAPVAKIVPPAFVNGVDSFSYAVGMSVGESLKQTGAPKINAQLFAKALDQVFNGGKTTFTPEQAQGILQTKLQGYAQNKPKAKKVVTAYMKECQSYMDVNKKKPGVTTLPNGLQYEVMVAGDANAPKPSINDQVSVNYMGTLINGTEFDNSYKRGQPATFPLTGVIRGWTEILQLMPKGSKWKVTIPSELAYGENPPSAQIPPSATLIFEIELLDIIKPGATQTPPASTTTEAIQK
jgi:FKBP-type peptidyl-prolyl cis-trans isomerase FklB